MRAPSHISGINWASPLAQGLQSSGLVLDGLPPINQVTGERPTYYSNEADLIAGTQGRALRFNDSGRVSETLLMNDLGNSWLNGASAGTIGVVAAFHGLGSGTSDEDTLIGAWSTRQASSSRGRRMMLRWDSVNNTLEGFVSTTSDFGTTSQAVAQVEDGHYYWLLARYDGTEISVWLDGLKLDNASAATGTIATAGSTVPPELMGGHNVTLGSGADSPRFDLKSWVVLDRAWTDSEIRAWSAPQTRWDHFRTGYRLISVGSAAATATATVTGTIISGSPSESDIVTGGNTIILTLTNDTWVAAGTGPVGSTADTQALIDGMTSAQSEGTGWNAEVRDKESTTAVVRTSPTVVTITLSAAAAYDITANETITVTIPAAVLTTSSTAVVAAPKFDITFVAAAAAAFKPPSGLALLGVGT